jgi:hypothetical protein
MCSGLSKHGQETLEKDVDDTRQTVHVVPNPMTGGDAIPLLTDPRGGVTSTFKKPVQNLEEEEQSLRKIDVQWFEQAWAGDA